MSIILEHIKMLQGQYRRGWETHLQLVSQTTKELTMKKQEFPGELFVEKWKNQVTLCKIFISLASFSGELLEMCPVCTQKRLIVNGI